MISFSAKLRQAAPTAKGINIALGIIPLWGSRYIVPGCQLGIQIADKEIVSPIAPIEPVSCGGTEQIKAIAGKTTAKVDLPFATSPLLPEGGMSYTPAGRKIAQPFFPCDDRATHSSL